MHSYITCSTYLHVESAKDDEKGKGKDDTKGSGAAATMPLLVHSENVSTDSIEDISDGPVNSKLIH